MTTMKEIHRTIDEQNRMDAMNRLADALFGDGGMYDQLVAMARKRNMKIPQPRP